MESYEEFQKIVAASPWLTERFDALKDAVKADGLKYFGVQMTDSDVMALTEVRLAALGDGKIADRDSYERGLNSHPAFAEVRAMRRLAGGDVVETAAAVEKILAIPDRARRISESRRLGISAVKESETTLSKAEVIQRAADLGLSAKARIDLWRANGHK